MDGILRPFLPEWSTAGLAQDRANKAKGRVGTTPQKVAAGIKGQRLQLSSALTVVSQRSEHLSESTGKTKLEF